MKDRRTRKLVGCASAVLAAAFVAVPVAQARVAVDARHASLLDRAPIVRTDARHAALLNKANVRGQIVPNAGQSKIAQTDRLPAGETPTASVSTGFDWSDAGIGASAVFGLVLLAGGGVLVTRRRLVSA